MCSVSTIGYHITPLCKLIMSPRPCDQTCWLAKACKTSLSLLPEGWYDIALNDVDEYVLDTMGKREI